MILLIFLLAAVHLTAKRGVFMREIEELSQYLTDDKVRGLRKVLGRDIQEKLSKSGIYFHIFSRLKSAGSIWQ